MILQALNRYYDILAEDQTVEIVTFGYSVAKVSFALNLSPDGDLLNLLPLYEQIQSGKKIKEIPRSMMVPQQNKRSGSNPPAYFLCDNGKFVLGLSDDDPKSTEKSIQRFENFKKLHQDLLGKVDSDVARSILKFLDNHQPDTTKENPAIAQHLDAMLKGANLVFMVQGKFAHRNADIRHVWETSLTDKDAESMQCLLTGEKQPIARLHGNITLRGGKSTGSSLVSFNKDAYESYNRSQGLNSPIGILPAFKYASILDYLLSSANPNKKFYLGDTTVIYWAESENRAYESAFASFVDPSDLEDVGNQAERKETEGVLQAVADKVKNVQALDLDALLRELGDENPRFHILGLSPNAARVSVRFFITDPFEKIANNIMAHYRDLAIEKEYEDQPTYLSVWRILNETVSKKSRDKDAAPLLAGAVLRAILTNAQYPAALYYAIINRIRADMDDSSKGIKKINYVRAAIMKAYLIRKYRHQENPFEEVLNMALNEQSTIPAYLLGRLFAVLEKVQGEAIGNVNASIKDRYFTSACASPASVFPVLLRLSQHHIAKAEYGYASERKIQDIMNLLDVEKNPIPARLLLDEQGVFVLGYYHQRANFYKKINQTEEKEN